MKTQEKILDILIPTFRRPESASAAIEGILECSDGRFSIRCNSNGFEPILEKYRSQSKQLFYDCFEKNVGAKENYLHLIKSAQAKFCMLLSDEDRLDAKLLPDFLDYLEKLEDTVKVISCSIFDQTCMDYYHKLDSKLGTFRLDKNAFAALGLLPSYISGTVYRVSATKLIDLDYLHDSTIGNAYPHLDIAQILLLRGTFSFYSSRLVLKGKEVTEEGALSSHRSGPIEGKTDNPNRDPAVYGPYARARQFYYREKFYSELRNSLSWTALIAVKAYLVHAFLRAVWRSPQVVVFPSQMKCEVEVSKAYHDSVKNKDFSGSITSRMFRCLVILPWRSHRIVFVFTRVFNDLVRKIYMNFCLKPSDS